MRRITHLLHNDSVNDAAEGELAAADANAGGSGTTSMGRGPSTTAGGAAASTTEDSDTHFGLFELWPATPDGEVAKVKTTIDLVAIHGLGGDAFSTWKDGERLWLRDFLPVTLPEVRVLTFGYDARVAFSGCAAQIEDFALQLLAQLKAYRRRTRTVDPDRKLFFVCHSLGGIVFKQALITAHARTDLYGWVNAATCGVMFMGTPHRGADVAYWGKVLGKIANIPTRSVRTGLLDDLQPKSRLLGNICSLFVERAKTLSIYSFYEQRNTKGLNDLIVDKDSAVLHLLNETPIPLNADHRGLCKFLTSSNPDYALVLDSILDLVDNSTGMTVAAESVSQSRSDFILALRYFDPEAVLDAIPEPWQKESCTWLTQRDSFNLWARDIHRGMLWIHGPAGAGKSVMAKYITKFLRASLLAASREPFIDLAPDHCVLHYFCNYKLTNRHTARDLLMSSLYQILDGERNSHLVNYLDDSIIPGSNLAHDSPSYAKLDLRISEIREKLSSDKLWKAFRSLMQKSRGMMFWIVWDGLDELDQESIHDVITGISLVLGADLVGRVKVIITSRSDVVRSFVNIKQELNPFYIDMKHGDVRSDVDKYIRAEVHALCNKISQSVALSKRSQSLLEDEMRRASGGCFLHAKLALANFSSEVNQWTREEFASRLGRLHEVAPDLRSHYNDLLARIPDGHRLLAKRAFCWVMASYEPLTLEELHFAITLENYHTSVEEIRKDMATIVLENFSEVTGFLLLIDQNGLVQFTHASVRDSLLLDEAEVAEPERNSTLAHFQVTLQDAHAELASACLTMLGWERYGGFTIPTRKELILSLYALEKISATHWVEAFFPPILSYFSRHWINHCRDSNMHPTRNTLIFDFVTKESNANIFRIATALFDKHSYQPAPDSTENVPVHEPPLHYVIQLGDFPQVVKMLLAANYDVNELDDFNMAPLHWAIARGRENTFQVLLNSQSLDINLGGPDRPKPIHICVMYGRVEMLYSLLADPLLDLNTTTSKGATALYLAMNRRSIYDNKRLPIAINFPSTQAYRAAMERTVAAILETRTRVNITLFDGDGHNAIDLAFKTQQPQYIMQMLWHHHDFDFAIATTYVNNDGNILLRAGRNDWDQIQQNIIKETPREVFRLDSQGMNALTWYAFYGREQKLRMILNMLPSEAWSAFQDMGRYNLINLCAHQNWEELVSIIQEKFHRSDSSNDHYGRTLLHWSVEHSWNPDVVKYANKSRSWVNQQDRDGNTAMHLCILFRNQPILENLLKKGADFLLKDKNGRNPVHVAAETGYTNAIDLFLDQEPREYGRDRHGKGLLHYMAMWQHRPIIQRYIVNKKAIIDIRDKSLQTPLHVAAAIGNRSAVEILLERGANVRARDNNRQTPLHCAVRNGHLEIVEILLDHKSSIADLDGFNQSNLQLSIRHGNEPLIKFILSRSSLIRHHDVYGETALHRACRAVLPDVVSQLLTRGADINARDNLQQTPLHVATSCGNSSVVTVLLNFESARCRIEMSARDYRDRTPLDWALFNNTNTSLIRMLELHGASSTQDYAQRFGSDCPYVSECEGEHLSGGTMVSWEPGEPDHGSARESSHNRPSDGSTGRTTPVPKDRPRRASPLPDIKQRQDEVDEPPKLPPGWKAHWEKTHSRWMYVNSYTFKAQLEEPTKPALAERKRLPQLDGSEAKRQDDRSRKERIPVESTERRSRRRKPRNAEGPQHCAIM